MPSTLSSAATKCISDVPGLVKQTFTPPATSVRARLSAPFIRASVKGFSVGGGDGIAGKDDGQAPRGLDSMRWALDHDAGRRTIMRVNATKAKLTEGKVVFGAIISRHAPDLVELLGAIGYDFVMIDCEHGPMSLDEVEHMVRAAEVFGITPITRIPNHEDSTILRFL